VARIGTVVHGIVVADAIVISGYQTQIGMGGIHTRIDNGDDDTGRSVTLRKVPGKLHISVIAYSAYARTCVASALVKWQLGGVVVTPVVGIISVVGHRGRIGIILISSIFHIAVGAERGKRLIHRCPPIQFDQKPAVKASTGFLGCILEPTVGSNHFGAAVDTHKLIQFIDPEGV